MKLSPSPYVTTGPYFPFEFVDDCSDLTSFDGKTARGEHIVLTGRVVEEGSKPIHHAMLELWQPDSAGVFRNPRDPRFTEADPGFFGWGRARTDRQGIYRFRTVIPGASNTRRPHADLAVTAIGVTRRLVTTVFFSNEPDPVLDCVTDADAKQRLIAVRDSSLDADGLPAYRFDIVLRGENETPFFVD
jgi:protocatechuate 3,4-dioxygenase alpha subunit